MIESQHRTQWPPLFAEGGDDGRGPSIHKNLASQRSFGGRRWSMPSRRFDTIRKYRNGASCDTFRHPPVDGSLTVPELYEYHATKSPQHPLFVYADEHKELKTIRYPEAFRAIQRAAGLAAGHYKGTTELSQDASHPPVCGILAVADTISYMTLIVGLMYIGLSPFPISTRNSAAGVAHLLQATGVQKLFISKDPAMQRLSKEAIEALAKEGYSVETILMPQFSDLYTQGEPEPVVLRKIGLDATAIIMHSSGSTAFPKPIRMSNRNFIQWGILPYHGEVDICNVAIAVHSLPVFHGMCAINLVWATCAGSIMACFKPSPSPAPPTPDMFLEAIVATDSKVVFCVPAFVEAWARSSENVPILQTLKALIYAGAPMNVAVGDHLSSAGVNLVPFYGSTEMGCFSTFIPNGKQPDEWQYFGISKHLSVEMVPQDKFENVFEPVVLASPSFSPSVINITIKGQPGYASSDLLLRHPTNPDLYKVFGRADDQIMLSTGEKTNPVPLETMFSQDPYVAAAIMFGRGRFQNGVLIQPKDPFEPGDTAKLTAFRQAIWPTVEKVNNYAPTHSRIFKEMIIVTSPSKPFEYTPKGTPQRNACLAAYEEEIEALYDAVKESSQPELIPPTQWTADSTLHYIRNVVEKVVLAPLTDDTDLFQVGCDSLQATWIRNTILRSLRATSGLHIHKMPIRLVGKNQACLTRSLRQLLLNHGVPRLLPMPWIPP
ncbi:hypothetical protein BJ138DRAFT_785417 [Hygrophoropsis aurantiaca]|uniref:Uncharacterized protein n=1 Tax=Hygrophoropsis aurantiaca TaxID=72124 RepID=A0ACB8AHN6_9AGAM|nr:hypothetical protein BJ138DRAFT_785417 [Hygrophoropsis aurantiaca]